ncbi:NUDIX hydrolase [Tenacibaculum sp. 190130A14a]|uniref:NUDIX hydrolase n=1 Tax=Tenacibaculum polynesiense TaxID=3137857 RepID=A0ABM9PFJ4_9FLAO
MYKVFVNDKPIILTSSLKKEEKYPVYIIKTVSISELIHKLKLGKYEGVYLYSNNLENDWNNFKKEFKVISAAGGLVLNDENEILFIYRGNKWDLPKGRIEKGESVKETAVREVEEECGISNISIVDFLLNTYHLFVQDNEYRLKETYWYLMKSNYKGKLTPQLEEGITKVEFRGENGVKEALKDTYANIKLVHECYKNV